VLASLVHKKCVALFLRARKDIQQVTERGRVAALILYRL
jgi:hypothetical protein